MNLTASENQQLISLVQVSSTGILLLLTAKGGGGVGSLELTFSSAVTPNLDKIESCLECQAEPK